jgi:hypothetical protein
MQELTIFLCNCLKAHVLSINIFPFLRALAHCLPVLEDEDQRLYHKNMKIIFPNYLALIGKRPTTWVAAGKARP